MFRVLVSCIILILMSVVSAMGGTYYMRADGKSSNKTRATSCSSPGTAMSIATHNKESFSPDDVIVLCDDGGDYKNSIIASSSGAKGHPLIYKNADGKKPVIDLSVDVGGGSGWENRGGGVFRKRGSGRVLWEDNIPLKAASSESCSDGNWFYPLGSNLLYYKPTSGTPSNHSIRSMWFQAEWAPYGLDLRNRSYITVQGLNFTRCGGGIGHGQNLSSPVSRISNIVLHNNTFTRCMWAIWSQVMNNGVESDVSIHDNFIDYCNGGISAWTGSDSTPGHTQHHTHYSITGNRIMHLYSITAKKVWSDALLTSYYYNDHEGISFQDVQDSVISNNTISATFDKKFTSDEFWTRAIFLYLTNGSAATSGNTILRNYVYGHYFPAIYISTADGHAGFQNNTIAYNVLQYEGADTDHISFVIRSTTENILKGANYLVNNTVYNPKKGIALSAAYKNCGNWTVRNNIFSSLDKINISPENDKGNMTFDHNIFSSGTGFQVGNIGMNFVYWRKKHDAVDSRVADPLFVVPGSDFHLRPNSPAKKAGVNVGLTEDFSGAQITGKPSIGAYESSNPERISK